MCMHMQAFQANADTKTLLRTFILIVFVTVITDQIKASGDKHVLATLNMYTRGS